MMVATTRVFRPHVLQHNELWRCVFVLFGDLLPDPYPRRAVHRADLLALGHIVHDLFTREFIRYRLLVGRRDRGEHLGLVEQHSLIGRHVRRALLGGAPEDLRLQPVNLFREQGVALDECGILLR